VAAERGDLPLVETLLADPSVRLMEVDGAANPDPDPHPNPNPNPNPNPDQAGLPRPCIDEPCQIEWMSDYFNEYAGQA